MVATWGMGGYLSLLAALFLCECLLLSGLLDNHVHVIIIVRHDVSHAGKDLDVTEELYSEQQRTTNSGVSLSFGQILCPVHRPPIRNSPPHPQDLGPK